MKLSRWSTFIRSPLAALSICTVACTSDHIPTASLPQPVSVQAPATVLATNEAVTGYWRVPLDASRDTAELWLYRNDTEIGVNVHSPHHMRWVGRDSVGTLLVRHTIYWDNPLSASKAQLADAVALAPDGATMLVLVVSKLACVNYARAGNRAARYQEYTDYVRALAASVPRSGRVRVLYWQIYNEMNYPGWTNMFGAPMVEGDSSCAGDGSSKFEQGQKYAELLASVYPAIKEVTHDSAWVVIGGFGSDDASTDVYSPTGRYGFLHGMYASGARDHYDIAAIQPYGRPGAPGLRRISDMDRALAVYGDEARPMFMTEFGSRYGGAQHWSDLFEQIESTLATRIVSKAFIYVMCSTSEAYSLRITTSPSAECDGSSEAYQQLHARKYNASLYGGDSVVYSDVIIRQSRGQVVPTGYEYADDGASFRVLHVPVRVAQPTRIRFVNVRTVGAATSGIEFRAFLGNYGWSDWRSDSSEVLASGISQALRAIQVRTNSPELSVSYSVYSDGVWSNVATDGSMIGDTTRSVSAIRARVTQVGGVASTSSLCYSARTLGGAWIAPVCDGSDMGRTGSSAPPLDAVRMWMRHGGTRPIRN